MSHHAEIEITVTPRDAASMTVAARFQGREAFGALALPVLDAELAAAADELHKTSVSHQLRARLGRALFAALFHGDLLSLFATARAQLADHELLRLRLVFPPEASHVGALPWELTVDTEDRPLALVGVSIARGLPRLSEVPSLTADLPLRVLLTAAHTPPPVAVARELEAVRAELTALGDKVHVTEVEHLSLDGLLEHLRDGYHVWHFVGHGRPAPVGSSAELLFEEGNGPEPVGAEQLSYLLNRCGLRLAVIDSCDSGRLTASPNHSIAASLIRSGIPAVVAMQASVADSTTRAFARGLYRALVRGMPIDDCVLEGRRHILRSERDRLDWAIPVLYLRSSTSQVMRPAEPLHVPPATNVPLPPLGMPTATSRRLHVIAPPRPAPALERLQQELRLRGVILETAQARPLDPAQLRADLAESYGALVYLSPASVGDAELDAVVQPELLARRAASPSFPIICVAEGAAAERARPQVAPMRTLRINRIEAGPERPAAVAAKAASVVVPQFVRQRTGDPLDIELLAHPDSAPSSGSALVLDWRERFKPDDPSAAIWKDVLMPALLDVKAALLGTPVRSIDLRANARLSAALAFGHTFRKTAGFTLGVYQYAERWAVDRPASGAAPLQHHERPYTVGGSDTTVEVSGAKRDITRAVDGWLETHGEQFGKRIRITVTEETLTAEQALLVARQVAEIMAQERRLMPPAGSLHLFMATSLGVAALLGWHLNTCEPVQCYQLVQNVYAESCLLV